MIPDQKGGPVTWLLERYVAHKVRSAFRGMWARGALPSSEGGLLVYLNHSSFWDGFIVHQLAQVAGWNGFAMMEEAQLARYRFHTRIGAFSVKRGDPASALTTLRHARSVLRRPGAALIVFPEGVLLPGGGPLGPFARGVEVLARAAKVRCLPVAVRYAFLEHEFPDVLLDVGAPHPPAPTAELEARIKEGVERLATVRDTRDLTRLLRGRSSVQERWDAVRAKSTR
jgi:1-acyl-sn-glycerol-3-phosphate acyltransferase